MATSAKSEFDPEEWETIVVGDGEEDALSVLDGPKVAPVSPPVMPTTTARVAASPESATAPSGVTRASEIPPPSPSPKAAKASALPKSLPRGTSPWSVREDGQMLNLLTGEVCDPLDLPELPNGEAEEKVGDEWGESQDVTPGGEGEDRKRDFDEFSQVNERIKLEDAGDKVKVKKSLPDWVRTAAKVDKQPLPGAWSGKGKEKPEKATKGRGKGKGR